VTLRQNVPAGIGLMLAGVLLFSVNDALGKWLVATYSVGQLLLVRSVAVLLILFPVLGREVLPTLRAAPRPGLQAMRAGLAVLETACFFWAAAYLPLADVLTFYLAGPIYVAVIAAVWLDERLDRRRAAAALFGFLGVLVALRPSEAMFSPPALVAFAGSLVYALFLVATRRLAGTGDRALLLWPLFAAILFGAVTAPFTWTPPSLLDLALLACLGLNAVGAQLCINRSLRLAPASAVVPYQYTMIVWAAVFGYLVFGDVLEVRTALGAALIIASGLALFFLEKEAARRAARGAATVAAPG